MYTPAAQTPQQITIHGAEGELTARGALARVGNVVEQPSQLRSREIRVEQQAGFGAHQGFVTLILELGAEIRRPPVLPDDGAMQWAAAPTLPQQCRLALIGDADRSNV